MTQDQASIRIRDISLQTRATLEILIREIQEAIGRNPMSLEGMAVEEVLDQWIRGSDLHPENVKVISHSGAKK